MVEPGLVEDVRQGLRQRPRRLSCRWLYDAAGSLLFEEICRLPEYYIPAAEREILTRHADEIVASVPAMAAVVELGSGTAEKTTLLLQAALRMRPLLRYVPIDISAAALAAASQRLAPLAGLSVHGVCAEYEDGLAHMGHGARLVLWLGSNIGNFDRDEAPAFLRRVAGRLTPTDRLLVGVDRRKRREAIERAYDDPRGVTARFIKNILLRLNRELGADFDPDAFRHSAIYDVDAGRVSIYLVSERAQRVRIPAVPLEIDLAAGERIHTEDSYKYSDAEIRSLAQAAGLRIERIFSDDAGRFSDILFSVAPRAGA
jgi:L-histidine N-alpha-methyltransferase